MERAATTERAATQRAAQVAPDLVAAAEAAAAAEAEAEAEAAEAGGLMRTSRLVPALHRQHACTFG